MPCGKKRQVRKIHRLASGVTFTGWWRVVQNKINQDFLFKSKVANPKLRTRTILRLQHEDYCRSEQHIALKLTFKDQGSYHTGWKRTPNHEYQLQKGIAKSNRVYYQQYRDDRRWKIRIK